MVSGGGNHPITPSVGLEQGTVWAQKRNQRTAGFRPRCQFPWVPLRVMLTPLVNPSEQGGVHFRVKRGWNQTTSGGAKLHPPFINWLVDEYEVNIIHFLRANTVVTLKIVLVAKSGSQPCRFSTRGHQVEEEPHGDEERTRSRSEF